MELTEELPATEHLSMISLVQANSTLIEQDLPNGAPEAGEAAHSGVCWNVLLQFWRAMAADSEKAAQTIETREQALRAYIHNHGYTLNQVVDPAFMDRILESVNGTNPSPINVGEPAAINQDMEVTLLTLVRAYQTCCECENFATSTAAKVECSISGADGSKVTFETVMVQHPKLRPKVNQKTVQNEISALRKFIDLLGQTEADDCSWMADETAYQQALTSCNITCRSLRSALNQARDTVSRLVKSVNPANTLWESYLRVYYRHIRTGGKEALMTKNSFIRHCFNATGMSRQRLNSSKILVREMTYERIKSLEATLGADIGELTRFLIKMGDENAKKHQTDYSKRVSEAVRFEYAFPYKDWPEDLKEEWKGVYLLRTEPLKASRRWGLNLEEVPKKKIYKWRIRKHDGHCPSAKKQRQELEWFFGWCLLPRVNRPDGSKNLWRSGPDRTLNRDQLSMSLIMDLDLLDGYIEFRKAHTLTEASVVAGEQGVFNNSCDKFIEFTSSLLNPLTGFVYLRKDLYFRPSDKTASVQNVAPTVGFAFYDRELAKKVEEHDSDKRWLYHCKKIRGYMEKLRQDQFDRTIMTRDRTPIKKILALEDPMQAMAELLIALEESEPAIDYWKNFHRRKRLFFALVTIAPLRILQFAFMTGNHLYKIDDLKNRSPFYQFHFARDEFKNERFIAEKDYFLDIPDDLTECIDDYLGNVWPALNGRAFKREDRIFATGMKKTEEAGEQPTRKQLNDRIIQQLEKLCTQTTARHLGEKYSTPGFRPHAIRHIKGTSIVKITGSFEQAADVLWDSILTIKKDYAHVRRQDQLANASREAYARLKKSISKSTSGSI